jgi:deazaflavin-dependent oxidoreductase (nitroreductase family)
MQVRVTTVGRRTGRQRTVTLYAFETPDGAFVITGSRGGNAHDPRWAHNLRANPRAKVEFGREEHEVVAREVAGEERERLWKLVTNEFPMYETYQRRTKRTIPLFVLEDRGPRP